jgi:hypothetical protein
VNRGGFQVNGKKRSRGAEEKRMFEWGMAEWGMGSEGM